MKASELIQQLVASIDEYGDKEVRVPVIEVEEKERRNSKYVSVVQRDGKVLYFMVQ